MRLAWIHVLSTCLYYFADVSTHPSQQYVQAVASSNDGSWLKLWLWRGVSSVHSSYTKVSLPPQATQTVHVLS